MSSGTRELYWSQACLLKDDLITIHLLYFLCIFAMGFALLTIYCKGSTKDAGLNEDQPMSTSANVELARVTTKKDSTLNEETGVTNQDGARETETETKICTFQ